MSREKVDPTAEELTLRLREHFRAESVSESGSVYGRDIKQRLISLSVLGSVDNSPIFDVQPWLFL